jgi:hypothetical protein
MRLRSAPSAPTGRVWMLLAMGGMRPEWREYLHLPEAEARELAELSA